MPGPMDRSTGSEKCRRAAITSWENHKALADECPGVLRAVRRHDCYSGVDVVYHGNQREMEYDFVVEPTAPCNSETGIRRHR